MKKILIADDSATLRKILRDELEKVSEYQIFEASNGAETLESLEKIKPDLITLDVDMPDIDGYLVCFAIRKLNNDLANTPVIFVTSSDTMESRQRGHRVGGNDFIVKPFVPAELHSAVKKQLFGKSELKGARILLVDDSPLVRQILENYLVDEQINLVHAESGEEALKILQANIASFDAVITDYNMPGLSGEELCRAIRKDIRDLDLPVIIITSKKELAKQLFGAGASDYLPKPFTKEELLARVRIHLRPILIKRALYENLISVKKLTREMEQKNSELLAAKKIIEEKTLEITQDLIIASEFQQKYFGNLEIPDYMEIALYYQPVSYVSGDFYMLRKNNDGDCNILIGDVAGHGIAPAFVTMVAKTLLDQTLNFESVSEIMKKLSQDIGLTIPSDRYLTAALARINEEGTLFLANAGHPGIILIPADGSELKTIKPEGTPLGMFDEDIAFFDSQKVQLNQGDTLVLFTDGILEQMNNQSEAYGLQRLKNDLLGGEKLNPEALSQRIMTNFERFVGASEIEDDQTLIIIRYK